MPGSTIVTGMVLSAMPVGDYDKRLVILTKELGRITAFAKGARRPNSAFLACSQPFSFGKFTLYGGKSYNVMQAEISNYFGELRGDFNRLCYGLYFCEFADYLTKENNDETNILKLLYQTLRALTKDSIEVELIRGIFELKIMALNGEAPYVFGCVKCDKNQGKDSSPKELQRSERYYFSVGGGGILCNQCKGFDKSAIPIQTSTLYTMQYIISKEIEKLYTFKVSSEVLGELKLCMKRYLSGYVEHEFKSLDMVYDI